MKKLIFTKRNNLSQLHDELFIAIPSLTPVNGSPVMRVEGDGDSIFLTVPDGADSAAITSVVNAHIPAAPVIPPDIKILWQNYRNAVNGATTVAALKAALTNELGLLLREILKGRTENV